MTELPPGHRLIAFDTVASTNEEALRLAALGEAGGLWVTAQAQANGRGRGGRAWSSPPGNLYASHLLRLTCPLTTVQQLTLLAPVSLFDAVAALLGAPRTSDKLRLKWPNDVLVVGAKVSGILLESVVGRGQTHGSDPGIALVMGFGVNLASHPSSLDQAATHLAAHGCGATPEQARAALAQALERWLTIWNEGQGFAAIRTAWLERSGPIGETLRVRVSSDPAVPRIEGRFAGLDVDGALLLDHADGSRSRHIQGDVALGAEDR
jgi:BirA family transcriptional regulator, biotin operon repressor / biotin---[acetyl-CoA-carboxylase] ligase